MKTRRDFVEQYFDGKVIEPFSIFFYSYMLVSNADKKRVKTLITDFVKLSPGRDRGFPGGVSFFQSGWKRSWTRRRPR